MPLFESCLWSTRKQLPYTDTSLFVESDMKTASLHRHLIVVEYMKTADTSLCSESCVFWKGGDYSPSPVTEECRALEINTYRNTCVMNVMRFIVCVSLCLPLSLSLCLSPPSLFHSLSHPATPPYHTPIRFSPRGISVRVLKRKVAEGVESDVSRAHIASITGHTQGSGH